MATGKQEAALDLVFMALADATRRDIVRRLSERAHTVGELAGQYDMSLAAVSKHIKVLEHAKIISRSVVGRTHHLSLAPHELTLALDWISIYRNYWRQRLDALGAAIEKQE